MDDFKQEDSLLNASNKTYIQEDSLGTLYISMASSTNILPALRESVDSLFDKFRETAMLIESLKRVLNKKDTIGNNTAQAGKLLCGTKSGLALTNSLADFYNYSRAKLAETNEADKADGIFIHGGISPNDAGFTQKYFNNVPTVAAVTILSKFKNDCVNLCIYVLNNIKLR